MRRYELSGSSWRWALIDDSSLGDAGHVLMELKFRERLPVWMADLVRRLGLVQQGYSKYGSAVRRARFEQKRLWDLALADGRARWGVGALWI